VTHSSLLTLAVALGLRHGVDPDHLAAIDGLSRLRPSRWNGVLFAAGHGALVTLLAVGVGGLLARSIGSYAPWLLILLGVVNLWRLKAPATHRNRVSRIPLSSPLLLVSSLARDLRQRASSLRLYSQPTSTHGFWALCFPPA
jgi:high-affinity nickel-transport protein